MRLIWEVEQTPLSSERQLFVCWSSDLHSPFRACLRVVRAESPKTTSLRLLVNWLLVKFRP